MTTKRTVEILEKLRYSAKGLQNHPDPRVNRLSDLTLMFIQQFEEEVSDDTPKPVGEKKL